MGINSIDVFEHLSESEQAIPARSLPGVDDRFVFDAFLLFPQNRAFLVGQATRLAGYPRAAWLIGLLLLFTLFTSLFLFITLPGWQNESELETSGQIVEARVESRRLAQDREGTRSYHVTYSFWADETGRYHAREQCVSRDTYERLEDASPVNVRYLPSDPDRSTLDDDRTEITALSIAAVLTAVAGLAALTGFVVVFVRRHRHDTLVRRGQVLPGDVIHFSSRTDSDGHYHIDLRYRVMTPAGRAIVLRTHRRADELRCCPRPKPGDPVAVLYVSDRRFRLL